MSLVHATDLIQCSTVELAHASHRGAGLADPLPAFWVSELDHDVRRWDGPKEKLGLAPASLGAYRYRRPRNLRRRPR